MELMTFFIMAVLIERVTQWVKEILGGALPEKVGHLSSALILSFAVSLLITFGLNLDLFVKLGLTFQIPYLGLVLTAWAVSGGSNYLFDLLKDFRKDLPEAPAVVIHTDNIDIDALDK